MERKVGTVAGGIRCPIIRQGDDLAAVVADSVLEAAREEAFSLCDLTGGSGDKGTPVVLVQGCFDNYAS